MYCKVCNQRLFRHYYLSNYAELNEIFLLTSSLKLIEKAEPNALKMEKIAFFKTAQDL